MAQAFFCNAAHNSLNLHPTVPVLLGKERLGLVLQRVETL